MRPVTQVSVDDTWSALRFRPIADVKPHLTLGEGLGLNRTAEAVNG